MIDQRVNENQTLRDVFKDKEKTVITKELIEKFISITNGSIDKFMELYLSDKEEPEYTSNLYLTKFLFSEIESDRLKKLKESAEQIKIRALNNTSKYNGKWDVEPELPERFYSYEPPENFDKYFDEYLKRVTYNDEFNHNSCNIESKEVLIELVNNVKKYFSGFLTNSVFIYEHKSCSCEPSIKFQTKEELIKYCSRLTDCALYSIEILNKSLYTYSLRYAKLPK